MVEKSIQDASTSSTGLLPSVEPASGLAGSAAAIPSAGEYAVSGKVYEAAVKGRSDFRKAFREAWDALKNVEQQLAKAFLPKSDELLAIRRIGVEQDLSDDAVVRQALRLYQLVHERAKVGETFHFSGDAKRAEEFAGLAWPASVIEARRAETAGLGAQHESACPQGDAQPSQSPNDHSEPKP